MVDGGRYDENQSGLGLGQFSSQLADDADEVRRVLAAQLAPHFHDDTIGTVRAHGLTHSGAQPLQPIVVTEQPAVVVASPAVEQQSRQDCRKHGKTSSL